MRIAETITLFDGHYYQPGEEIPDLGSFVAMPGSDKVRYYEGLAKDMDNLKAASKLPQYGNLQTGSSATCIDTGDVYKYEKTTGEWYMQKNNSGGGGSGTENYNDLNNKPKINEVILEGNKTLDVLGIQSKGDYVTEEKFEDFAQPEEEDIDFSGSFK